MGVKASMGRRQKSLFPLLTYTTLQPFNLSEFLTTKTGQINNARGEKLSPMMSPPGNGEVYLLLLKARNAENNSFLYSFCI